MRGPEQEISHILARAVDGVVTSVLEQPDDTVAVELHMRGQSLLLSTLWAGEGRPHEVAQAIAGVGSPWPEHMVVVARRLSPAALDLLRQHEANWADATGSAKIIGGGIFVLRGDSDDRPQTRDLSWSASSVDVAEAVLGRSWPRGIGTGVLASLTGWSPGQVSQILQTFDSRGWTAKVGPQRGPKARRRLLDTDGLLDAWAEWVSMQPVERRIAHGLSVEPLTLLDGDLGEALNENVRWALTGWGATEATAPIMTAIPTLQIYVAEKDFYGPLSQAIRESSLQEVSEGGAVEFWAAGPGALRLSETHRDLRIASAPRVYADLLRLGGRGEDAAQHIRQSVIDTLHRPLTTPPPTRGLIDWQRASLDRLAELVRASALRNPYEHGSWSASYRLLGADSTPSLPALRELLMRAAGRETGWPMWSDLGSQPRIADRAIECWVRSDIDVDPSRHDFWRADPNGLLFLLRGYEEDGDEFASTAPGTALDLTLPIWRVGECLLHAARLGQALEADRVEVAMRWEGLSGRALRVLTGSRRYLPSRPPAAEDKVESHIELHVEAVEDILPEAVRALVGPLYAAFDFFEPDDEIYRIELDRLRRLR